MAQRRAFGSVRKLTSGRHQARYIGPDGISYKGPRTYESKDDATGWLRDEEKMIERGDWISPEHRKAQAEASGITVRHHMASWLDDKEREGLKASTMTKYRERVRYRITAEGLDIADTPVTKVTAATVRKWWDQVVERWPDSGELNRKAYQHLRSAFDDLVDDEVVTVNPVVIRAKKRVVKPKMEKNLPTLEEQEAIYEQAPQRYKAIALLTQFHGLRIGEALGLKRSDIEIKPGTVEGTSIVHVNINDNYQRVKVGDKWVMQSMGSAKTAQGNRRVPILARFHTDLFEHMETFTGPNETDLLTTTRTGKPVFDTAYRSTYGDMKKRAGITRRLHPHAGRRFIVSALLEQGYEPTAVGEIIGDKDLKIVLEIYAQVRAGRTEEIMSQWGDSW